MHAFVFGEPSRIGVDGRRRAGSRSGRRGKARVSPVGMKQMSCESGLSATDRPRAGRPHPDRLDGVSPRGNIAGSAVRSSTASTYD